MTEDEKDSLLVSIENLIREAAAIGGWKVEGNWSQYTVKPCGTTQNDEMQDVIYHLWDAAGRINSMETDD